jgi:hypothetical protein
MACRILGFHPSSGAAKAWHEGLSLLSHVSMERIIEINILVREVLSYFY